MKKIISIIVSYLLILTTSVHGVEGQPTLEIDAKSVILMESSTGKILYDVNCDERLPIASVTKIMTMLLICESVDSGKITLDDMVPVSERAMSMGGSTMFLEAGESLSVSDMLKGIAVASANVGCVAMAEFLEGSVEAFVEKMNTRAKELGMENTNFVNTNGLDVENHYSSAKDVAIMSRELLKHELIFNYTKIWTDSLRNGKFELANTNKLIRFYDGATGLKTGSTSEAMCCISATAKRDDLHLIAVVLGAPDSNARFAGARTLLDYGFSAFSLKKYTSKNEDLGEVEVLKGEDTLLSICAKDEISLLKSKGENPESEKNLIIKDNLKAPIKVGDIVGELIIAENGNEVARCDILASESIEKKTFGQMFSENLTRFFGKI